MNRAHLLKATALIAIAMTLGVLMMACSTQTTNGNTSSSAVSHSLASGLPSSAASTGTAEARESSATAGVDLEAGGGTNPDSRGGAQADPQDSAKKTIACIGDSITYGHGLANPEKQSWPALLQEKLGDEYRVINLGVSGTTLDDEGRYPYRSTGNVEKAKQLGTDLFFIMLGTNDADDPEFDIASYRKQLIALVDELAASAPQSQFVLMAPPRTFFHLANDPKGDRLNRVIGEDIRSAVKSVATEKGARYIDLYALTEHHPEWFPDYLHPNAEGASAIADYILNSGNCG